MMGAQKMTGKINPWMTNHIRGRMEDTEKAWVCQRTPHFLLYYKILEKVA
jgi:hypothetical protein